jgi:hypothetical protein
MELLIFITAMVTTEYKHNGNHSYTGFCRINCIDCKLGSMWQKGLIDNQCFNFSRTSYYKNE